MPPTINKRRIITLHNSKSPISESYVKLRTNIELSAVDGPIQTILFTSANPGEGKSTTVANLAVVFAQADKKVLIIDADLRKPTMHHFFSLSNRMGLTSVLTNRASLLDATNTTAIPSLKVLTSGPIPPNPSELLGSKRMEALLQELRQQFDVILIDTPPSLAVADAQIMAKLVDGAVIVLHSGKVKREDGLKVKSNLELAKARILGVVLNNLDRKNMDSYYYYYYGESQE